jgi:hypothetical protein
MHTVTTATAKRIARYRDRHSVSHQARESTHGARLTTGRDEPDRGGRECLNASRGGRGAEREIPGICLGFFVGLGGVATLVGRTPWRARLTEAYGDGVELVELLLAPSRSKGVPFMLICIPMSMRINIRSVAASLATSSPMTSNSWRKWTAARIAGAVRQMRAGMSNCSVRASP